MNKLLATRRRQSGKRLLGLDPCLELLIGVWHAATAADIHLRRGADAGFSKVLENPIRHLLGESPECRPLATDQRIDRERPSLDRFSEAATVIPADLSCCACAAARQRTHGAKTGDNAGTVEIKSGKDAFCGCQDVIHLFLITACLVGRGHWNVGRANNDAVMEWKNEAHAAFGVLVEDLTIERLVQLGIIQHQVRALRAADEFGFFAELGIGFINPSPSRIDQHLRLHLKRLAGHLATQGDRA